MEYLYPPDDNNIYEIGIDEIRKFHRAGLREQRLGEQMTASSYRGEHFWDKGLKNELELEYLYRDPLTAGFRVEYPHGLIVQQAARTSYFRGENRLYPSSVPSLLRKADLLGTRKERELYRLVADMRVAEFRLFLQTFEHVRNWNYGSVLYDILAQHYGLETCWLDMTSDFDVALFFATCYYDNVKKAWFPLTRAQMEADEESRYGMIFHIPSDRANSRWTMNLKFFVGTSDEVLEYQEDGSPYRYRVYEHPEYLGRADNLIYPIGFQPFMRCHMQSGYAIYMREANPLQEDWMFQKLRFRQSEELSNRVYEYMEGGEKIYPHEGLRAADFVIDQIRNADAFSYAAFEDALYRSHYYQVRDREQCLEDLAAFSYEGRRFRVGNEHPWKLSAARRRTIDSGYTDFSIEKAYHVFVTERRRVPRGNNLFEPWMVMTDQDEPGVVDMHSRELSDNTDITVLDYMRLLYTVKFQQASSY